MVYSKCVSLIKFCSVITCMPVHSYHSQESLVTWYGLINCIQEFDLRPPSGKVGFLQRWDLHHHAVAAAYFKIASSTSVCPLDTHWEKHCRFLCTFWSVCIILRVCTIHATAALYATVLLKFQFWLVASLRLTFSTSMESFPFSHWTLLTKMLNKLL